MRRVKGIIKVCIKLWEFPKDLPEFFRLAGSVPYLTLDVPCATVKQFKLFYDSLTPTQSRNWFLNLRDLFTFSVSDFTSPLTPPDFFDFFLSHFRALTHHQQAAPHFRTHDIDLLPLFLRLKCPSKSLDTNILKKYLAPNRCCS